MSRPLLNVARKHIARRPRDPDRLLARSQTPCACAPPTRQVSPVARHTPIERPHIGWTRTTRDCPRKSAARSARPADSGPPSGEAPQVGPFTEIAARCVLRRRLARGAGGNRARTPCRNPPRRRAPRRANRSGAVPPAFLPLSSRRKRAPCCRTLRTQNVM
ncbi:hypothetical protein B0H15DRAFT_341681 [Mycena belliarum]|uniref:Uncharacterized protein n=1 Tax=Mycena belliarum TaxID=1033014 RepID=A0AAD6U1E3_9AGAR|nr:hypothetical protein B0H15DRAFT_341681 [Mycena belliae]